VKKYALTVLTVAVVISTTTFAQGKKSTEAGVTKATTEPPRVLSAPAERNVQDTRGVVKGAARSHIENSSAAATGGRLPVTSRDRPAGPLTSSAHDRGAVDLGVQRSRDPHADARAIAKAAGPGHKAIVEEPGRKHDTHTSYTVSPSTGTVRSNTYQAPARATGPHIHVQPEYEVKKLPARDTTSKYQSSGSR
jgi:hypothetical protein